jgi:hypothetical protein
MNPSVRPMPALARIALSLLIAASAGAVESAPAPARQASRDPASAAESEPALESGESAPAREEGAAQQGSLEELPRQILPRRWYNY